MTCTKQVPSSTHPSTKKNANVLHQLINFFVFAFTHNFVAQQVLVFNTNNVRANGNGVERVQTGGAHGKKECETHI